jgi:predicted nucleic acid-binding protein
MVVDAAILVAAARGRSSGAVLDAAAALNLVTTDRAVAEARRRIELGMKRPDLLPILEGLILEITLIDPEAIEHLIPAAERVLREAPAARNGSTRDAHVLALAWEADADIWTTDRDFAGAGVATWSTPNLMRALIEPERAIV